MMMTMTKKIGIKRQNVYICLFSDIYSLVYLLAEGGSKSSNGGVIAAAVLVPILVIAALVGFALYYRSSNPRGWASLVGTFSGKDRCNYVHEKDWVWSGAFFFNLLLVSDRNMYNVYVHTQAPSPTASSWMSIKNSMRTTLNPRE